MKSRSILLVLTVITGAARGALEGGCGRAGALRCDADGRHVSACTRGGEWRRVLDCGASHGACVDGRCVGAASANARAEQCCTPGEWGCSSDCVYKTICTSNHLWSAVAPCPAGYICDSGECVNDVTNYCKYTNEPICGKGSSGHLFPDMDVCSRIYACSNEGAQAQGSDYCRDTTNYYHPCSSYCVSTSSICDRYQSCNGNEGLDAVIPGNPSLHYICANGTMFLMKCAHPNEIYNPLDGKCFDAGMEYCAIRINMNIFSKSVPFDECASTDGSTTTTDGSITTTDGSITTTDGSTTPSLPCIVGEKWEDPGNECKYYYCYPPGVVVHMSCPPNSKYDATVASCVSASGLCLR